VVWAESTRSLFSRIVSIETPNTFKAAVLGWAIEWSRLFFFPLPPPLRVSDMWLARRPQAYLLVSDDMMNSGITRRGPPCWYCVDSVGMMAVNDALILEGAIFQTISGTKRFMLTPLILCMKYVQYHLFRKNPHNLRPQVSCQMEMGGLVDLITASKDRVDQVLSSTLTGTGRLCFTRTPFIPSTSRSSLCCYFAVSPSRGTGRIPATSISRLTCPRRLEGTSRSRTTTSTSRGA